MFRLFCPHHGKVFYRYATWRGDGRFKYYNYQCCECGRDFKTRRRIEVL